MKVAHVVIVTPGKCGLYETTHDTVRELRSRGIDSRLVDLDPKNNPVGFSADADRGVPLAGLDWARQADVVVSHSGIGDAFADVDIPQVYVAHGRPLVSYLSEKNGQLPIQSYHYRVNKDPKWKAVVTYWPEHVPYHRVVFYDTPVFCVPASCDTSHWTPGDRSYDFGGHRAGVNVVIADQWRDDVDPFRALMAFGDWAAGMSGVKLHIYGLPKKQPGAWAIVNGLADRGMIGEVLPWCDDLRPVYRAADFVLTPHSIAVRTMREAMACGCPVVTIGESLQFEEPRMSRAQVRTEAVQRFSSEQTGEAFAGILETLNNGWLPQTVHRSNR